MLSLLKYLERGKFKFKRNYSLKEHSSIKIGPLVDVYVEPCSIEELKNIISFLRCGGYKFTIIGGLTNTLFLCESYSGTVISTLKIATLLHRGKTVYAECGVRLSALMRYAEGKLLGGYPGLCHIPGTVGAAVRGNVGSFGNEISDIFIEGCFLNKWCEEITLTKEEMQFGYRSSRAKREDLILLSAKFGFIEASPDGMKAARESCFLKRRMSQPLDMRSLGSVFLKADGASAGYYIELAGLKGYRIGGAAISEKHAGFIVNLGDASASDVMALIEYTKNTVFSRYGVRLTEEIEIIR